MGEYFNGLETEKKKGCSAEILFFLIVFEKMRTTKQDGFDNIFSLFFIARFFE